MNYIISASTDIGIKKSTNQDSLFVQTIKTKQGQMVFAVLCDGMGGLAKGELASATLIRAFSEWVHNASPMLSENELEDHIIREQWNDIITCQNERIHHYGKQNGISLGTTVVALLVTDHRYYVLNVGDSRAYQITDGLWQITNDQTVVAHEIAAGNLTPEQAETDPRRSVLLQCVGASNIVYPDMFFGETRKDAVYMLCSDGFRHEITAEEIYEAFAPEQMTREDEMKRRTDYLIEINKQRNEQDNISVITIRTF